MNKFFILCLLLIGCNDNNYDSYYDNRINSYSDAHYICIETKVEGYHSTHIPKESCDKYNGTWVLEGSIKERIWLYSIADNETKEILKRIW